MNWDDVVEQKYLRIQGDAINQPLLLLFILASAQQDEKNEFRFTAIEDRMEKWLQRFCSNKGQKHHDPALAFWHLEKDDRDLDERCWIIEDRTAIKKEAQKRTPSRKLLREKKAVAHVPGELWDQLSSRACYALLG